MKTTHINGMWLIEQRDVGLVHLIHDEGHLVEHRISNDDVGMVYIVDKKGDRIEFAPYNTDEENASTE